MSAVWFFVYLLIVAFVFLLLGGAMTLENQFLNVFFNGALYVSAMLAIYAIGVSHGTDAVSKGEIMFQRQETGRAVDPKDKAVCFHPAKGLVGALLGSLPLFVCAVILAVTAVKTTTGIGTLPSWISSQNRSDVLDALTYYQHVEPFTITDAVRVVIRLSLMPIVNMIGIQNPEGLLTLEHISPLIVLVPAFVYGAGYLNGPANRSRVHTAIAQSDKKRKRRNKKKVQKVRREGPGQLN